MIARTTQRRAQIERTLTRAIFVILALSVAAQIWSRRGLYADGSWALVYMLDHRDFYTNFTGEKSRFLSDLFLLFPTVFAVWSGVTNIKLLTWIFSSWYVVCPAAFWGLSLWKTRRDLMFWPLVLIFTITYFNGNFCIVGEYNLSFALSAFCLALMLREETLTRSDYVWLFVAALLLTMSYASTIYIGPLLTLPAFAKFRHESSVPKRYFWLVMSGFFAISCGVGLWGLLLPNDPDNRARALDFAVLKHAAWFWMTLGYATVIGAQFLVVSKRVGDVLSLILFGGAVMMATGISYPPPIFSYLLRVPLSLFVFIAGAVLIGFRFFRQHATGKIHHLRLPPRRREAGVISVFALFVIMAGYDVKSSLAFAHYLDDFTAEVNSHTGLMPFETTMALIDDTKLFGWTWTFPATSLVLRRDETAAIILNSITNTAVSPIDPYRELPDLRRYYH